MAGNSVIHKQVIKLETATILDTQLFEVPIDANMVDIQWDTRDPLGIAFWYKVFVPVEGAQPRDLKHWKFMVRGTGQPFPEKCSHLSTVVRDGYAWHVLDADGGRITWAEL